jgi:hypothetical protein
MVSIYALGHPRLGGNLIVRGSSASINFTVILLIQRSDCWIAVSAFRHFVSDMKAAEYLDPAKRPSAFGLWMVGRFITLIW